MAMAAEVRRNAHDMNRLTVTMNSAQTTRFTYVATKSSGVRLLRA